MRYFVAVTDNSWFRFLAEREPEEANFWRPGGTDSFRAVTPGSPILFKLHSPEDYITGGGFFMKYEVLPLSLAWDVFRESNGASDLESLTAAIQHYRHDTDPDPTIGCMVLSDPFFFKRSDWIPVPSDWSRNIVQGKTYDAQSEIGGALWRRVSELLVRRKAELGVDLLKEAAQEPGAQFGSMYLARARLGQRMFRFLVTSAYDRRCAVSGERVLPVLDAAHIKPHGRSGPNRVANGLLLRTDIHTLFDKGFMTLLPDLTIRASQAIRDRFENGRDYYAFDGRQLQRVPSASDDRPAREYLEWHNANVFLG